MIIAHPRSQALASDYTIETDIESFWRTKMPPFSFSVAASRRSFQLLSLLRYFLRLGLIPIRQITILAYVLLRAGAQSTEIRLIIASLVLFHSKHLLATASTV